MNEETRQLDRIAKAALEYYDQVEFNPTQEDFERWIKSLREPMKSEFIKKGREYCKSVLNFKRFYLESRDFGMTEFMKNHLSPDDFRAWTSSDTEDM